MPDETQSQAAAHMLRSLLRFLWVIKRRKWIVICALALTSLLGALYYLTAERKYQATAALLVQQTGSDMMSTRMYEEPTASVMGTYERLFTSDIVLAGAVKHLEHVPPELHRGAPPERWPAMLRRLLSTSRESDASIIEIGCRSSDRLATVAVVNAVVQSYLEFMDETHKNVTYELVTRLDQERRELEERLAERERQLLEARRRCGDIGIADSAKAMHPLVQRAVELNSALLEHQQQRLQVEASLTALRQAMRTGGDLGRHLMGLESVIDRELVERALNMSVPTTTEIAEIEEQLRAHHSELATLLRYYGPAHPKVIQVNERIRAGNRYLSEANAKMGRRLAGVQDTKACEIILERAQDGLAILRQREEALAAEYREAEKEAVALNDGLAEMSLAERDIERLRRLHDTLLDRIASIDMNQETSNVRLAVIRDALVPGNPVSPQLARVVFVCLLIGVGGGLVTVYGLDLLDDRFRSPDEMKEQLGVPVLAMIRDLPARAAAGPDGLQVHIDSRAVESEAFRTLRTALAFTGQNRESLAITSSEPGDGKTTVLANLGVSFAQAGKRTLLVDADMRKPGLSKLFDMRGLGGLSEVLRSDDSIRKICAERVRPSGVEGLDVLPSGPKPADPADLLAGSRMEELMAWAEANYDQVLVDCPPILAASDAIIASRLTEGLLLVVDPEKNHRRLILRAVEEVVSLEGNILGVVVNRVGTGNEDGYYGYGYGAGYGYGYGRGYGNGYGYGGDDAEEDVPSAGETDADEGPGDFETPRRAA